MSQLTLEDQRGLYYRQFGDTGSQSVLLHGYLDSHMTFYRLFEALAAKHRLYTPDHRGHGESFPAPDYTIAGFTEDAIAFIESIAEGPVHLGGHSLGGIVAQRVAARRPDLVRSLALIGTARHAGGNRTLLETAPLLEGLSDPVPDALGREFQLSSLHEPMAEEIFSPYLQATRKVKADVWRGALAGLLDEPAPVGDPPAMPTLILWGEEDGIFPPPDQERLRQAFPRAAFISYPKTGHAPNWERPEESAAALLAFWRGLDEQEPCR
ncbi:alpha/beta fold hydrolase [Acidocella sp.]|uniref:alpha/beta fold hydrolase n=1 Tax=Acidocella sp. TaxID=50710 RepID=UPI003D007B73